MKLSRRRKEKEKHCHHVLLCPQPGRSHSHAPAPRSSLNHFHSLSLHPAPPARSSTTPVSPPPRVGRAMPSSYPSPAVPLLPSFFIKLLKQKSVERRTVAGAQLADPAVLLNDNRARPARRYPCSFIQSGGYRFSPVPMAPSLWWAEP